MFLSKSFLWCFEGATVTSQSSIVPQHHGQLKRTQKLGILMQLCSPLRHTPHNAPVISSSSSSSLNKNQPCLAIAEERKFQKHPGCSALEQTCHYVPLYNGSCLFLKCLGLHKGLAILESQTCDTSATEPDDVQPAPPGLLLTRSSLSHTRYSFKSQLSLLPP